MKGSFCQSPFFSLSLTLIFHSCNPENYCVAQKLLPSAWFSKQQQQLYNKINLLCHSIRKHTTMQHLPLYSPNSNDWYFTLISRGLGCDLVMESMILLRRIMRFLKQLLRSKSQGAEERKRVRTPQTLSEWDKLPHETFFLSLSLSSQSQKRGKGGRRKKRKGKKKKKIEL